MARRSGARPLIAPSASLALVSSILIALAALAPNGAAASGSETTTTSEATVAPVASVPAAEPALTKAAQRDVERQAHRAEREAAQAQAAAVAAEARQAEHAAKQAEHAAEREARKASGGASATAPASARAGGQSVAKADKSHAERQHEHEQAAEQRRHEKEARGGRTRESKKQREAREAREAAGGEEESGGEGGTGLEKALSASGGGRQPLAAGGVSNIEGGSASAQPASTSTVAGAQTGSAARSVRGRSRGHRGSGAAAAGTGAFALSAGAALASGTGLGSGAGGGSGGSGHAGGGGHHKSSGKAESTIVRTVTQIVGVIPAVLWLLIGLLGLAAAAFAIASRVSARRARRLDSQRRALLEDVGLLQAALLPELPERLGPVATSAAYRPASGPGAGGDFYDVFALPEGLLAVIVGDVSGHGREALPHTTLLRYTLRAYMEAGLAPREALRAAAPALERQLGGSFATVVLASWDPRARRLTYACAGHPHPIVSGLDPSASILAASAPPIGAGNPTGSRQTVMTIPGAATTCFYTDGVIEARASGELYGTARLASALSALRAEHADTRPEAAELLDRVAAETDRRPDDMAACLLELAGEDEAPRILSEELLLDAREAGGKRARRFLEAAGVSEPELGTSLDRARTIAAEHGSAVLTIDLAGEHPRVSVLQDNIAPLRARALARTQEVAL